MVVAARHWRKICQTTLVNYGISEACAVPLLMIGRLGEGVRQVQVAQAAGMESPSLVRLRHEVLEGIERSDLEATLRVLRAFEAASSPVVVNS